jgi:hypothetical protein
MMKGIRCSSSKPGSSKAIEINATDEGYITARSGNEDEVHDRRKEKIQRYEGEKNNQVDQNPDINVQNDYKMVRVKFQTRAGHSLLSAEKSRKGGRVPSAGRGQGNETKCAVI